MKTYSHDAIRVILNGETFRCDRCGGDLVSHSWITLRDDTSVVECSGVKKNLTDGTTIR